MNGFAESPALALLFLSMSVLLVLTSVAIVTVRSILGLVALLSVYSSLMAMAYAVVGAVDVSFTEAVVGTGLSTVFFMALLTRLHSDRIQFSPRPQKVLAAIAGVAVTGLLAAGVMALPVFGSHDAPASQYLSPLYVNEAYARMATPNVVTAVLADFRGFDTLIETAVVLTAALACVLILKRSSQEGA